MNQQFLERLQQIAGEGNLRRMEPMSRHTTFRVGGPADVMVWLGGAQLAQAICLCRELEEPYTVIGNGSNLLVGDGGIRGLVIAVARGQSDIRIEGSRIVAGAGAPLARVANLAAERGLGGMEFAAGIPGTVGGAVVMNAGAYGSEMKDIIERVTVLDSRGQERELALRELELGYRRRCMPENGYLVTEAVLSLCEADQAAIREKMREFREMRITKQPLEYPSAGSTFKRPEGYFAGKLIMDAGLRGYRVGGAQVSEKHCGFVINEGGATARDIWQLIRDVSGEVERQFHVRLEPEVKLIGEF